MNALFSFGISFLIRLFAGLPAPGLSPGCFRVSPAAVFGVSRNFVGIIFYTRKVLLTSHYEKRLFEHASQPRVAGSDIRLLSYLWS